MYKPKKYNTSIVIEGRKNYHNFTKWLMINNIIYTTIEVELMNKYQFNLEDISYKQYVYIRRLKKIL